MALPELPSNILLLWNALYSAARLWTLKMPTRWRSKLAVLFHCPEHNVATHAGFWFLWYL